MMLFYFLQTSDVLQCQSFIELLNFYSSGSKLLKDYLNKLLIPFESKTHLEKEKEGQCYKLLHGILEGVQNTNLI